MKSLAQEPTAAQATASGAIAYLTVVLILVTCWYAYSSHRSVKLAERTATVLTEDFLHRLKPSVSLGAQGPFWSTDFRTVSFRINISVEENTAVLASFEISVTCSTHNLAYKFRDSDFVQGQAYDPGQERTIAVNFDVPCSQAQTRCNPIVQPSLDYTDIHGYRTYRARLGTGAQVIQTRL